MSDDEANKYVKMFDANIAAASKLEERQRLLRLLVKEVERDTHHAACEIISRAASEVHNLAYK